MVVNYIVDAFVVCGGVIGYIFQYRDILKSNDASGFSPFVCLILLTSSLLRCVYRYGKYFETTLFLQSIVMIFAQLALLELCVRTNRKNSKNKEVKTHLIKHFWDWTYFIEYVRFLISLSTMAFAIGGLIDSWVYWEFLGSVAMGIEACLALPQLLSNHKRKSTAGCSMELVASWVLGDVAKTFLFWLKAAPLQFLACGIAQLLIDFVLIGQIVKYRGNKGGETKEVEKKKE